MTRNQIKSCYKLWNKMLDLVPKSAPNRGSYTQSRNKMKTAAKRIHLA